MPPESTPNWWLLFPGARRGTTIATMKKLLLLVLIAALATIATKKVRSA
jgi:hypothetical protein